MIKVSFFYTLLYIEGVREYAIGIAFGYIRMDSQKPCDIKREREVKWPEPQQKPN